MRTVAALVVLLVAGSGCALRRNYQPLDMVCDSGGLCGPWYVMGKAPRKGLYKEGVLGELWRTDKAHPDRMRAWEQSCLNIYYGTANASDRFNCWYSPDMWISDTPTVGYVAPETGDPTWSLVGTVGGKK